MKNKILVLLTFVFISVIKLQAQVHAVDDYYTTTSNSVLNGSTVLANDTAEF